MSDDSFSHSEESSTSDDSDSDSENNFIEEDENPEYGDHHGYYGDYPCEPYADEPLADEEWIRAYELKRAKKEEELQKRKSRLDGTTELSSWCKCGQCKTDLLQSPEECCCCKEIEKCVEILNSDEVLTETQEPPVCVTLHPAFPILCLNKWSLKSSAVKFRRIDKTKHAPTGSEEKFLKSVSYRELVQLIYGQLDKTRILPLPACAYCKIRSTFSKTDDVKK